MFSITIEITYFYNFTHSILSGLKDNRIKDFSKGKTHPKFFNIGTNDLNVSVRELLVTRTAFVSPVHCKHEPAPLLNKILPF